jgi:ferrous iron transport protein A
MNQEKASMDRVTLDQFETGRAATVRAVGSDAGLPAERASQLADIGFIPGEVVMVLARAWPGGDPLVVRIGHSRFALRCAEAACVTVEPQA